MGRGINYGVAASELSYPLCSIIDAVAFSSKEKKLFMDGIFRIYTGFVSFS